MTRILHVVAGMDRGGVETWLMHILRHIDRTSYQMDFLVHTTKTCDYDNEILDLGSQIIPCMHPSKPLTYARKLRTILQTSQYDVVHSHIHHYSGWTLKTAAEARVPKRIAHSHNDTSAKQAQASPTRRGYLMLMKYWIQHYSTRQLSVSKLAANSLFKSNWLEDPRHRLLYYGIDLKPFEMKGDCDTLRSSLNIPNDGFVIGHVGRFVEQKNHSFLIEIAIEACKRSHNIYFLLVGDGPLRPEIEQQVSQAGLRDRILFAGIRDDVPALMTGVMNGFLFPSLHEGLPVTLIEVQAAGLPAIISNEISDETDLIESLLCRLNLNHSASEWAQAVLVLQDQQREISQSEALKTVNNSSFNIKQSLHGLMEVYDG